MMSCTQIWLFIYVIGFTFYEYIANSQLYSNFNISPPFAGILTYTQSTDLIALICEIVNGAYFVFQQCSIWNRHEYRWFTCCAGE